MFNRQLRRRTKHTTRQPAAIAFTVATLVACGIPATAQGQPSTGGGDDGAQVTRIAAPPSLQAALLRERARLAQSPAQAQPPQGGGWIVRHPVVVGTLVGTGVGAALSRSEAIGGVNHDARVALAGAGAGAWGGLVASAVHKARIKEKVGAGTKIGIVAGAVAIAVLPWLACYGAGGCGGSS